MSALFSPGGAGRPFALLGEMKGSSGAVKVGFEDGRLDSPPLFFSNLVEGDGRGRAEGRFEAEGDAGAAGAPSAVRRRFGFSSPQCPLLFAKAQLGFIICDQGCLRAAARTLSFYSI